MKNPIYLKLFSQDNETNDRPRRVRTTQFKSVVQPTLDPQAQGQDESAPRVVVRIVQSRRRLLDAENLWASVKHIVDGLKTAGLIRDDSPKEIVLQVVQEQLPSRKNYNRNRVPRKLGTGN